MFVLKLFLLILGMVAFRYLAGVNRDMNYTCHVRMPAGSACDADAQRELLDLEVPGAGAAVKARSFPAAGGRLIDRLRL